MPTSDTVTLQKRDETTLIREAQDGNLQSFEQLIKLYSEKIYNLSLHLTKNQTDAEDLFQEAFLKVYENIKKFDGRSSLGTWIYRITTNIFINNTKAPGSRAAEKEIPLDDSLLSEPIAEKDAVNSKSYELQQLIPDVLKRIPEEYRMAIILCDLQGYDYKEISEVLEIPVGTVRSRLSRGRQMLKDELLKSGAF